MKFYLCAMVFLLVGCQQTTEQTVANNSNKTSVKSKIKCQQSTTPPLKSTQKLKEMLLANGKINESMSDEEIDHTVKAYIRKKNSAYKNCKK